MLSLIKRLFTRADEYEPISLTVTGHADIDVSCPGTVLVRYRPEGWRRIEFRSQSEPCDMYAYRRVYIRVGRQSGQIHSIEVDLPRLRKRAMILRTKEPDWPKYFNSVVSAHIEVLKFSTYKPSFDIAIVSKLMKVYGDNFFS